METKKNIISLELIVALLLIATYFMPWVDMAILVKVVGWDIPQVQDAMREMSKEFTDVSNTDKFLYGIYIIPLLAVISIIGLAINKMKIARVILAISSIIGLILSIVLCFNLPNIGSGVIILLILSLAYLLYFFFCPSSKR